MEKDINGREFSWHNVFIIDKADCCFFRLLGDKSFLEVDFQKTIFDSWDEAEEELERLRKEEE